MVRFIERPSWDQYFLDIARVVASRADCRRRQVGAVIVDQAHRILATGYNGAPSKRPGCLSGACPRGLKSYDEVAPFSPYDSCIAIHAEDNAIQWARDSVEDATIYVTCSPCKDCMELIVMSGIYRIVHP